MKSIVNWKQGLAFDAEVQGHAVRLDGDPGLGGTGYGPMPKALVLTALAGCTAMDVASILAKMRVRPRGLSVEASGEVASEHPKVFTGIRLTYRFDGDDLPVERLQRAIELSLETYCSVTAMLEGTVPITWEVWVGDRLVDAVPA